MDGGGGGIRTHGAFGTRDFQSRPLGLYGTPPDTRGGRGGIRTHGALLGLTAFRERHLKPLGHPSAGEYSTVADSPASSRSGTPLVSAFMGQCGADCAAQGTREGRERRRKDSKEWRALCNNSTTRTNHQRKQLLIPTTMPPTSCACCATCQDHARSDTQQVNDPKARALFETTAEVLGGLITAYEHYQQNAPAWR
jgi:hypothetical protein